MPDITNPEAIAFVNTQIRPLCETVRALHARLNDLSVDWFSGNNSVIGTSADDDIADGREAQGVSRLTAADVTNAMSQLLAIKAILDGSGVAGVIEKPCVRPIEAS